MSLTINDIRPLVENLNRKGSDSIPPPARLSGYLKTHAPSFMGLVKIEDATLFITASIEMWQRAINSLILSIVWSDVSRSWAVVTAYYSSHYMIRAFAHLYGYYSLNKVATVELSKSRKGFQIVKGKAHREHEYYWNVVSDQLKNRLFGNNIEQIHRGYASYQDHLDRFKVFNSESIPNSDELKMKIGIIADLPYKPLDDTQIPDLTTLQCLSYKRICFYRNWFETNFESSRYWKSLRTPKWWAGIMVYKEDGQQLSSLADINR